MHVFARASAHHLQTPPLNTYLGPRLYDNMYLHAAYKLYLNSSYTIELVITVHTANTTMRACMHT